MIPSLSRTTTRTTTRSFTATLTAEDIRKAFGLPDAAKIEFRVPGGGDWSNCSIEIDADHPICVAWKEVEEDTFGQIGPVA